MPEIAVADALARAGRGARASCLTGQLSFCCGRNKANRISRKTTVLRRRLLRLLRERETPSRLLNLRHTLARVEYWLTGSKLESAVRMYELARQYFPKTYLEVLRLRMPPYVKVILDQRISAQPRHHPPGPRAGRLLRPVSRRARRPSDSNRSFSTCSRCAAARKTSCLRPRIPAAFTARWACACAPASRW